MSTPATYVVLLRGINAGPRNRIRMPELQTALENAGGRDVETVAQTGNVVITYDGGPGQLDATVRRVLRAQFDLTIEIVIRTADAFRAIVEDNPLGHVATDGRRHIVVFCSEPHDEARLPKAIGPEQLVARPLELHAWCPAGVTEGKLVPQLGRRPPAPVTTFRNWNTVAKIGQLLDARASDPRAVRG